MPGGATGILALHATPKVMKLVVGACHGDFMDGLPDFLCSSFSFWFNLLGLPRHVNVF